MLETLPVLSAKLVYNPYAKHPKFFRLVFIFTLPLLRVVMYVYHFGLHSIKKHEDLVTCMWWC
jgi:hypothetical protein